jgi:hypothetical protein
MEEVATVARRPVLRRILATGLVLALLAVPMAGSALALTEGSVDDGSVDDEAVDDGDGGDATDAVEEEVEEAVDTVDDGGGSSDAPDESGDHLTEAAKDAADGVREVVEKAAAGDPQGAGEAAADTAESTTGAVEQVVADVAGTSEAAGDDEPTELATDDDAEERTGPHRSGSTRHLEPDGDFADRSASRSSGFSSRAGASPSSPSEFDPPATAGVFEQDPQAAEDGSAGGSDVASLLEGSGPDASSIPSPREVPASLLLVATVLLVMVGTGHVLHAARQAELF